MAHGVGGVEDAVAKEDGTESFGLFLGTSWRYAESEGGFVIIV